jgi:hypothetical protein
MLKINEYTIGSDFEIFVNKGSKIIPALVVPGTKDNPEPIGENCYIQRDGVAAEFNICPVDNKEDFQKYFNYCFEQGNKQLAAHGLQLDTSKSSHLFDSSELDQEDLRQLLCNYSYDAYSKDIRVAQVTDDVYNLRTTGLHLHIGFQSEEPSFEDYCLLSKYFDLHLCIPSLLLDQDKLRRKLYGQAGDFRFKRIANLNLYEYRSLGSSILNYNGILSTIYDQIINAIKAFNNRDCLPKGNKLNNTINSTDIEGAKKIIRRYNLLCHF